MNKKGAILVMLLMWCCLSTTPVRAQDVNGNPANWCRNGLFPAEQTDFKLAKVNNAKGARTHFYSDDENCPSADAKCRLKSYVVPGDQVLVSRQYGSWVCSWYQPRKGHETVGWLPAESLSIYEPDARPGLAEWLGLWNYYDNTLNVRRGGKTGFLTVKGDALWRGLGDNVHVGAVAAEAQPQGNELILVEEECRVVLKLVGDFLLASDNSECGGANVRFNGVYKRGR